jgi:hypothetical protein
VLLFVDRAGHDAGRAISDDRGNFTILLSPGQYALVPQPVTGLLGTAPEQEVAVPGTGTEVTVVYDTGIR